jgi:hypothetical protein
MSNALAKINKRVKQLQKRHPGAKRTTLQKQAGREYRAGKLGGVRKNPRRPLKHKEKPAKNTWHPLNTGKPKKKRVIRRPDSMKGVSRNTDKTDNKRVSISVGSVAHHVSAAKKALVQEIGWNEATKLTAKTAKAKRALQKRINEKKSLLRKLQ